MALTPPPGYPWYACVSGPDLAQGDMLPGCPIFETPVQVLRPGDVTWDIEVVTRDMIVMTQSCDLAIRPDGVCAASEVTLCPVYFRRDLRDHPIFRKSEGWNGAKKGRLPAFHVLNQCRLEGHELDYMVIDLGRVASLNVVILREFAASLGERVRLLPPYREHLAQAFARFFMRVGLPEDIPDFK